MSKLDKVLIVILIMVWLICGFSIKFNSFHFEFKGLGQIILELIFK